MSKTQKEILHCGKYCTVEFRSGKELGTCRSEWACRGQTQLQYRTLGLGGGVWQGVESTMSSYGSPCWLGGPIYLWPSWGMCLYRGHANLRGLCCHLGPRDHADPGGLHFHSGPWWRLAWKAAAVCCPTVASLWIDICGFCCHQGLCKGPFWAHTWGHVGPWGSNCCLGHIAWMPWAATWGHGVFWTWTAAEGHVWVLGSTATGVCIEVHDSGCPWGPSRYPCSGLPPWDMLAFERHATTMSMLIWVICNAS